MRLIISPAKKMRVDTDMFAPLDLPVFVDDAEELSAWVKGLSAPDQKRLWACNDAIAAQNRERFATMDLRHGLTPALVAYDGIQYTNMAPSVFSDNELAWVQEHLRILSGLYGVLRPFDGVTPYRLEMQAKATVRNTANLYEFWGKRLYEQVVDKTHLIVNLASKEYAKAIERHLRPEDTYVTCVFGELVGERVLQRATYAKMARGQMVRHLASIDAHDLNALKSFSVGGYAFDEERSTSTSYVFVREGVPGQRQRQ